MRLCVLPWHCLNLLVHVQGHNRWNAESNIWPRGEEGNLSCWLWEAHSIDGAASNTRQLCVSKLSICATCILHLCCEVSSEIRVVVVYDDDLSVHWYVGFCWVSGFWWSAGASGSCDLAAMHVRLCALWIPSMRNILAVCELVWVELLRFLEQMVCCRWSACSSGICLLWSSCYACVSVLCLLWNSLDFSPRGWVHDAGQTRWRMSGRRRKRRSGTCNLHDPYYSKFLAPRFCTILSKTCSPLFAILSKSCLVAVLKIPQQSSSKR